MKEIIEISNESYSQSHPSSRSSVIKNVLGPKVTDSAIDRLQAKRNEFFGEPGGSISRLKRFTKIAEEAGDNVDSPPMAPTNIMLRL
jgi:hypothetical protein